VILAELASREDALYQRVLTATGLMEEKHAQLQDWGIFDEYRDIHRFYAALIIDPKSGLEALKRALFLGWYDLSEPACFTGIFNLSAEVNRYVLAAVETKLGEGGLDLEMEWMLPFYYSITDSSSTLSVTFHYCRHSSRRRIQRCGREWSIPQPTSEAGDKWVTTGFPFSAWPNKRDAGDDPALCFHTC
jgi:hypothetical protein